MKTLNELKELQKKGKMQILTMNDILNLKGKEITTLYYGYRGQDGIDSFKVGEVISEYDNAARDTDITGFDNRAEYWGSFMTKEQLFEKKTTYMLFTAEGRNTYMKAYPFNDGWFSCSDSDRFVFFLINDGNETN